MFEALLGGVLLGLAAGFSPGPLMVLVISSTLRYSMAEGLKVSLSPVITDLPIIAISLYLMGRLSDSSLALGVISFAGALFVFHMGWGTLRINRIDPSQDSGKPHSLRLGVIANFLSPHPYLFWFSLGAPLTVKHSADSWMGGAGFILSFYIALIGSKMLAALLFGKARHLITGNPYVYTMRVLGVLLMVFSLLLLEEGLAHLGVRW
jgi:threonine/homoserine/homoserine lactone efflux protein